MNRGVPIGFGIVQGVMVGVHLLLSRYLGERLTTVPYTWSYLFAANILLLLHLVTSGEWRYVREASARWSQWGSVGLVNVGIQLCMVKGVALSGAATASVLVRSDLLFGMLLARILYKERAHPVELMGGGMMVWGVIWVMGISKGDLRGQALGDLCLLVAGLLTAANGIAIKYRLAGMQGSLVAYFNTLVATLVLSGVLLVSGDWRQLGDFARSGGVLWLLLSGGAYAISLMAYYFCLEHFPVWVSRSFTLISPILAIVGGWLWFAEQLTLKQASGALIVMAGMVIILVHRARRSSGRTSWGRRVLGA